MACHAEHLWSMLSPTYRRDVWYHWLQTTFADFNYHVDAAINRAVGQIMGDHQVASVAAPENYLGQTAYTSWVLERRMLYTAVRLCLFHGAVYLFDQDEIIALPRRSRSRPRYFAAGPSQIVKVGANHFSFVRAADENLRRLRGGIEILFCAADDDWQPPIQGNWQNEEFTNYLVTLMRERGMIDRFRSWFNGFFGR